MKWLEGQEGFCVLRAPVLGGRVVILCLKWSLESLPVLASLFLSICLDVCFLSFLLSALYRIRCSQRAPLVQAFEGRRVVTPGQSGLGQGKAWNDGDQG